MAENMVARPGLGRTGGMVLGLSLAALVAFIASNRNAVDETTPPATTLQHIPAGAILVAEIDVTALRRTPIGEQLLGEGRDITGLGEVTEVCGSDPLAGVERMAFAIPEVQGVGFGLFATGDLDREPLLSCASEIVKRRGGRPERTTQGRFEVLRDAAEESSGARLAMGDGGPLILTEPAYLSPSLAVATESSAAGGPHAKLRDLVPPGVIVITAVLSPAQRATLLDELQVQGATASPLKSLRDGAISLRIAGVAPPRGAPGEGEPPASETSAPGQVSLSAVLRCDDAAAARQLAADFELRRKKAAGNVAARLMGLGRVLDALQLRHDGERIHVDITLPADEVGRLLQRLAALGRRRGGLVPPPAPPRPALPDRPPSAAPSATSGPLPPDAGLRLEAKPSATTRR